MSRFWPSGWWRHPLMLALVAVLGAAVLARVGGLEWLYVALCGVAGWACAFWFVGRTLDTRVAWLGPTVHGVAVVALIPTMIFMVEGLPDLVPDGHAWLLLALGVQAAFVPAAGWAWICAIGRISGRVRRTAAQRSPVPPEWDEAGQRVQFQGVAVERGRLRVLIVGAAVVTTALAAAVIVAALSWGFNPFFLGPTLTVLALGGVVIYPVYALVAARLRRNSEPCSVAFVRDRVEVRVGGDTALFPLADITVFRWVAQSDGARVTIEAGERSTCVLVGVARQPQGVAARLPELTGRVVRVLNGAGLRAVRSREGSTLLRRTAGD